VLVGASAQAAPPPSTEPAPTPRRSEDPDFDPEEAAAQRQRERERPRGALPEVEPPAPPPWERHVEVGFSFAFVFRPFADGLHETSIAYQPSPGFAVNLQWAIVEWMRVNPYFVHAFHGLDIPPGGLAANSLISIPADATVSDERVATFVVGLKLQPTYPFTDRIRAWASLGVGWGRFEFPTMTVTETSGASYEVRRRSGSLVEFPLGLGVGFDVIERWVALSYEATAAPVTGQSGNAFEIFPTTDANGVTRDVGPFGAIEASFVQTLGLSIIL
jgi:hypothetical protein